MEDIKIYGHLISGISDDNSSYSNGDNWIAKAHDIYDEGFKNLSEEIVEGSLPIERLDLINRYLYNKEVNSTANLTEALSQETIERKNNDALLSAIDDRLLSQVDDIQDKLNNYKLYSIVTSLPTSNIDKNKIYIVASEEGVENNIYTEYIYTDDNTWEKLGEFKSDIDLTPYVKKTDESNIKAENLPRYIFGHDKVSGDSFYTFQSQNEVELNHRFIDLQTKTMDIHRSIISSATTEHSGVMSSLDKIKLNKCISSDDYVDINKSGILPKCPGTPGQPSTYIPIIDSRFAVPVAEWVTLKSVSNEDSIKIKPSNCADNDYHNILILPSVTSTTAGIMSADDKVKLDNLPSSIINTIDSEVSFSEILSGKVIEINYTTKNLDTDFENHRLIYIPTVNSEHIGLMSTEDKEKLDNVVKNTEPIVFTLGGLGSIFDDPWSIIPMVGQTKTLTDEELQKSNLINLYKILDSNNPIIINIQGVDAKHYYIKEKFGDELSGYGIIMLVENKELKIEYSTFTSSNPDGGVSLIQSTTISSKYIHQHVDDSSVNALEYCLIKKLDYDDILRRLSALEVESVLTLERA